MEHAPNGSEQPQDPESVPAPSEQHPLSPEEQERTLADMAEYYQGLRSLMEEKRRALGATSAEETETLRQEIAELEGELDTWEEFRRDVSPETQETATEKKERLVGILREAATAYQENHEKGEIGIGFLTDGGDTWYMRARIAEVTQDTVIFAEGDTFPLRYVEEAEPIEPPQ